MIMARYTVCEIIEGNIMFEHIYFEKKAAMRKLNELTNQSYMPADVLELTEDGTVVWTSDIPWNHNVPIKRNSTA
jgi:hypothetical protein